MIYTLLIYDWLVIAWIVSYLKYFPYMYIRTIYILFFFKCSAYLISYSFSSYISYTETVLVSSCISVQPMVCQKSGHCPTVDCSSNKPCSIQNLCVQSANLISESGRIYTEVSYFNHVILRTYKLDYIACR